MSGGAGAAERTGGGMAREAGDRPADSRSGEQVAGREALPARAGNDREAGDASGGLDRSLFRYIWRHSKRDQILICGVVLASLPLYFASLDLPRRIVNEAIQGHAFEKGNETAKFLILRLQVPDWFGGERCCSPASTSTGSSCCSASPRCSCCWC